MNQETSKPELENVVLTDTEAATVIYRALRFLGENCREEAEIIRKRIESRHDLNPDRALARIEKIERSARDADAVLKRMQDKYGNRPPHTEQLNFSLSVPRIEELKP